MKHSLLRLRLCLTGIAILLCTSLAMAQDKEPYVRLTGSDDAKTLTFYYGQPTDDALELAERYFYWPDTRAWKDDISNIQTVVFDLSFAEYSPKSTSYWFYKMRNLTTIEGMENLNTSNVTNMSYMFYDCSSLTSLDVSNFDTSNVTTMVAIFSGCSSLTSLDVSNFDTSNVTEMNFMFYYCPSLTSLDISNFDTSKVTDMGYMFEYCSGLTSLDLSSFDTSNVTNMSSMFFACSGLTSLDVSDFDTSKVTDMGYMFEYCSGLTSLDVSNFNTSNVINMSYMFHDCSSLTSLDVSNFNTSNVINMSYMFYDCSSLTSLDVSSFNAYDVTNMNRMFCGCSSLTSLDLSSFNTYDATNMSAMFSGCSSLKTIYVCDAWNTGSVTDGASMFSGCVNIVGGNGTTYNPSNIDVTYAHIDNGVDNPGYFTASETANTDASKMPFVRLTGSDDAKTLTFYYGERPSDAFRLANKYQDMSNRAWNNEVVNIQTVVFDPSFADYRPISTRYWFYGMNNLNSIEGIENLNTSNVTNMSRMFWGCSGLTSLDVSNFDTSNVTDMGGMFSYCKGLTSLDIGNFNTSNVTNMSGMFRGCSGLTSLDLSNFVIINDTHMNSMFYDCSSLTTIIVGDGWDTAAIINGDNMFWGCTNLVGGKGTVFDESNTDGSYAHIDGGADDPGYLTAVGEVALLLGDANCDGAVDVVDVTTVVDFILGKAQPTEEQRANADVNRDQSIDVVDLTSIVSIILGTYRYDAAGVKGLTSSDALVMDNVKCTMDNGVADIALMNSRDYVGFQMDVTLADGAVLNGVRLSNRAADHSVTYSRIADNTYRIVAYSLSGAPFSGVNGSLLSLDIEGNGQFDYLQFTINNALFSDGANGYTLGFDAATGIAGMEMDNADGAVYDLSGKRVGHSTSDIRHSRKGLYIVNGKTVLVK